MNLLVRPGVKITNNLKSVFLILHDNWLVDICKLFLNKNLLVIAIYLF